MPCSGLTGQVSLFLYMVLEEINSQYPFLSWSFSELILKHDDPQGIMEPVGSDAPWYT